MIDVAPRSLEQAAAELLDAADVRVVELSSVVARVVLELAGIDSVAGLSEAGVPRSHRPAPQLRGAIDGPFCEYANTLTASVPLRNISTRPANATEFASLACEAAIPDPCFWTPQLPHRYRLQLELACGDDVLARHERWIGLRPLGIRGQGFWFDGAGWVLRGADRALVPAAELSHWRDASLAMIVSSPDDALCDAASRGGVLLLADIAGTPKQIVEQLRRLSRHAAVGLAIVESTEPLDLGMRRAASRIILIQRLRNASGAAGSASALALRDPEAWPQVLLIGAGDPEHLARLSVDSSLPRLVERATGVCPAPAAARRACDALQADTAGQGSIAGYLIRAAVDSSKH